MSADWQEFALTDLYDISSGLSKPAEAFGSGYPFVSFKDVFGNYFLPRSLSQLVESTEKERHSCSVKRGDVFLTRTSETMHELGMSSVALNDYPNATFNGFTKRLRPKENPAAEVHPEFIGYCLRSPKFRTSMLAFSTMSTRASLNNDMISRLNIKLPPIKIQKEIAKVLRSLDNKIHLNTQTNQTLESIAQAIFKSWFVDFEPVKAKMAVLAEGGTREQAELAAMGAISGKGEAELAQLQQQNPEHYQQLAETAALFPSAMVESELGEIPEGWEVAPIGNLIESTIGGDWGKEEPDDKHQVQVRIIRGTDIPNIKTCNDKAVPTRFVEEKKLKNRALMFGDIVIEVSGGSPTQPTGRSIFISKEILARMEYPVAPASFCRLFRPKSIDVGFFIGIYLQIIYAEGKTWLYQNQSTGISNFQTTVFLEKELLAIPSNLLIESFVKTISPIIGKMDSNENTKLAELRDSLLPKLLSGEIDLSDIQSEVA